MIPEAHVETITHHYRIRYPAHAPRESDPHYRLFEEYRKRTRATARCAMAMRYGTDAECAGELELHHRFLEFAEANAADLTLVMKDFPDVTDEEALQRWVESEQNLIWLCARHHRGDAGVHVISAADWEAEQYVRDLIPSEDSHDDRGHRPGHP